MSAWMLSRPHFDLLVTAALTWELEVPEKATARGRQLINANVKSMLTRYSTSDGGKTLASRYEFAPYPGRVDPEIVLNAIRCLAYQSCEYEGWESSRACAWLGKLRAVAEQQLPGYLDRFGAVDPARLPGEGFSKGWYTLIDEHGVRTVRCNLGWPVEGRKAFEVAELARRQCREPVAAGG